MRRWTSEILGLLGLMTQIETARVRKVLRESGRLKEWSQVSPHLEAGRGTVIVELSDFGPSNGIEWRIWWTPEKVLELEPNWPILEKAVCEKGDIPAVDWCIDRYLDLIKGTAYLTNSNVPAPDDEFILPEPLYRLAVPFQSRFPLTQTVVLPAILTNPAAIKLHRSRAALRSEQPLITTNASSGKSIWDIVGAAGGGSRTAEEIIAQVREERDSWGDR